MVAKYIDQKNGEKKKKDTQIQRFSILTINKIFPYLNPHLPIGRLICR